MRKKILLLILPISLFFLNTTSYGNNNLLKQGLPAIQHFDRFCSGSANENWVIKQAPNGFMYFGNTEGLLEYDGSNWKIYFTEFFAEVRAISIDKKGRIYVGTPKEFGYFEPDTFGNLVYTSLTKNCEIENCGMIMDIFQYQNFIYFLSFHGQIYKYDGIKITQLHIPQLFTKFKGFLIEDNFLLYSIEAGLAIIRNDTVYRYHTEIFEKPVRSLALLKHGKNKISITTDTGIQYTVDLSHNQPLDYKQSNRTDTKKTTIDKIKNIENNTNLYQLINRDNSNILGKVDIYHGHQLSGGVNSFSTLESGLFLIDTAGYVVNHLHNQRGLLSNVVLRSFEDRERNLWVATQKGTSIISKNYGIRLFNRESGIEGEISTSLKVDNKLFIGTSNGLFLIEKDVHDFSYSNKPELIKNNISIKKLIKHRHNGELGILVGSLMGVHFYNFKDKTLNTLFDRFSIYGIEQYPLNIDILFISHPSGISIIKKYRSETFKFDDLGTLSENLNDISDLMFDNEGRLYISTYYSGLIKVTFNDEKNFKNHQYIKYGVENGLPRNDRNKWYMYNNTILAATNSGIYKYDGKENSPTDKIYFKPFSEINEKLKPGDMSISCILALNNELFVATERGGLYCFDIVTKQLIKDYSGIIKKGSINRLYIDDSNRIHLITSNKELLIFDETIFDAVEYNPELFFRKIEIGKDSIPVTDKNLELGNFSFHNNNIFIQVSSPSFSGIEDIIYTFSLNKNGKLWVEQSSKESIFQYPYLPSGNYELNVKAKTYYSTVNNLRLSFKILPPWYRAWYAWLVYGIISALIFLVSVRFYYKKRINRNIRRRKNAEAALLESQRKLKFLSDHAKETLWIANYKTSKYTFLSGAYFEMSGFTLEELMQKDIMDILTPPSKEKWRIIFDEMAINYKETGIIKNVSLEAQIRRKNGTLMWLETSIQLLADENDELIQIIGIAHNIEARKKAEEALAEIESKHRFIFNNTKDVFMILDIATLKFVFVAGAGLEMYGRTNEELMEVRLEDYFERETIIKLRNLIREKIKLYRETGVIQPFQIEEQQFRKDGSRIWVESTLQLAPDENGEIYQIVAIDRSIDERKKVEKALAITERKHKLIYDNAKETFWIADFRTLKYTYAAGDYQNMWGFTKEEILNKYLYDNVMPEMREKILILYRELFEKYNETGIVKDIDLDLLAQRKDGTAFWINSSIQLVNDENGEPQLIGISRSIEDRKRAEAALIESERKYKFISENVNDAIWILELKTLKFLYFSSSCYDLFGYTPEEMCKKTIDEIITPDTLELAYQILHTGIKNYLQTGMLTRHKFELRQFRKDKPPIWIEISIREITDEKGEPVEIIGISRDIEERKNTESLLIKQKKELESQQEKITDSIKYASEIQKIFLKPNELLPQVFPEHFVINRPKEFVSGDFYFCQQVGKYKIFILADCTGHGVPGAFMSLISVRFMKGVINRNQIFMPNEILDQLRQRIIETMHYPEGMLSQNQDGLDAAVITIDTEKKIMYFSGANMGMYIISDQQLDRYSPDMMPVGSYLSEKPFSLTIIPIKDSLNVYVHTDGFVDQINNRKGIAKKFLSKRLQETLLRIQKFDLKKQAYFLEKYFDLWKYNNRQTDDVLFVGFRVEG